MSQVEFDFGVPLPARTRVDVGRHRDSKYDFLASMPEGASKFLPVKASALRSAVMIFKKKVGNTDTFSVRPMNENGVDGARVWKLAPKQVAEATDIVKEAVEA